MELSGQLQDQVLVERDFSQTIRHTQLACKLSAWNKKIRVWF